nr:197_t:CDS:2 [Entrophospora candida]
MLNDSVIAFFVGVATMFSFHNLIVSILDYLQRHRYYNKKSSATLIVFLKFLFEIFNITRLICKFGLIIITKNPNDTDDIQSVADFFFMEAIALFLVCNLRHSNKQLFMSSFLLILRTMFNIIYITSTRERIVYLRLSVSIDLIIDILSVYKLFKYFEEFRLILPHQRQLRETTTIDWNVLRMAIIIVQHLMLLSNTFVVNNHDDYLVYINIYKPIAEIVIQISLSYLIMLDMEFIKNENENFIPVEKYDNDNLLGSENSIEDLDENTKVMVSAQGFVIKLMGFINNDN